MKTSQEVISLEEKLIALTEQVVTHEEVIKILTETLKMCYGIIRSNQDNIAKDAALLRETITHVTSLAAFINKDNDQTDSIH